VVVTLGISTNTRLLGLAIISKGALVDYSIHLHKSSWSPSKVTAIITSLEPCVRQYCIKNVVLSIPHAYHQTNQFKLLISCIQTYFEAKNIKVFTKETEAIYTLCPPGQKKTKKVLMASLTEDFPQLSYCYHKEIRNKNKYYIKIFEAVAVATLHEQEN
jgi:hypothetical protein